MIDWGWVQTHVDWAGHILEALAIGCVVAALGRIYLRWPAAFLAGFAFAAGHFHGREKRDFEVSVDMAPPHLEGYGFWQWNFDQATDFWPTAIVMLGICIWIARRYRL